MMSTMETEMSDGSVLPSWTLSSTPLDLILVCTVAYILFALSLGREPTDSTNNTGLCWNYFRSPSSAIFVYLVSHIAWKLLRSFCLFPMATVVKVTQLALLGWGILLSDRYVIKVGSKLTTRDLMRMRVLVTNIMAFNFSVVGMETVAQVTEVLVQKMALREMDMTSILLFLVWLSVAIFTGIARTCFKDMSKFTVTTFVPVIMLLWETVTSLPPENNRLVAWCLLGVAVAMFTVRLVSIATHCYRDKQSVMWEEDNINKSEGEFPV